MVETAPVIVSFYTKNWKYAEHAKRLAKELDRYHIQHDIRELNDTGHYLSNTCLKPQFIRDRLDEYQSIVWLDVDTHIVSDPTLIKHSIQGDCALVKNTTMPRHWHVGISGWNRTQKSIAFLDEWIRQTVDAPTDDNAFERTWLFTNGGDLDVQVLPHSYHVWPHQHVPAVMKVGVSKDPTKMENKRSERSLHSFKKRR